MRALTFSIIAAMALLLSACVPAAGGARSSARQPLELNHATIEVSPGESLWVLSIHSLSELGFRDTDLAALQEIPESPQRRSARVTNWTSLSPVRVPPWWQVSLSDARIVTEGSGRAQQRTVQAVIRIDVPAQAALGPTELRISVDGRRDSALITVPLRVRRQAD